MKYVDKINKYRRPELPALYKTVSCWAPFQAIHINKKGNLKVCPFVMRHVREHKDTTPYEKDPFTNQARWKPGDSLRDLWQNDEGFEEIRQASMMGDLHEWCRYCKEQCDADKPPSSLDADWVGGERDLNHPVPRDIELELSNTCNYKCKFCSPYHSSQHMEDFVKKNPETAHRFTSIYDDPEVGDAFVESLREIIHEVYKLNFTGGEPFAQRIVHKILKMVEEENPENLRIQFTTNGSILNGYARKFAQRPNTEFTISLDSIDPEIYQDLRRNGNLETVLKHIDELQSYGVADVGCSFVISKDNVWTLPKIVSFCNRKNLSFAYHVLAPMGGTTSPQDIAPWAVEEETPEYLDKLRNYLNNALIEFGTDEQICIKNIEMYRQYIERLK